MQDILLGAVILLAVAVIGSFVLIVTLYKRQRGTATPLSDTEFRSRLARAVTTWALAAIAGLAVVIVICAGFNAISVAYTPNVTPADRKEATTFFFDTAQYVLTAVLPVVAAWVGTVLAFYFGRENYESAAKSATDLVRHLTPRQKLQSETIGGLMLEMHEITYYRIPAGKTEKDLTLKTLIDEGFEKDKSKPRNRLVMVDNAGLPKYVLHRSTLDGFIAAKKDPAATPPVTEASLTLEQLTSDAKYKEAMSKSYLPIAETASLADAKDILDQNPGCLDLLVTQDGTSRSVVAGWITNVMVLKEATL